MASHPLTERVVVVRTMLRRRLHADFDEIHRLLGELEEAIDAELSSCECDCHHRHRHQPATITVTTSQKGTHMGSYTIGTDVDLTAVVKNDQGVNIADNVTWTASPEGSVTATANGVDADGGVTMTAVLTGVTTPGDVAVTATTSDGLPFTDTITFTDPNANVPASITVTDTAATPAPTTA